MVQVTFTFLQTNKSTGWATNSLLHSTPWNVADESEHTQRSSADSVHGLHSAKPVTEAAAGSPSSCEVLAHMLLTELMARSGCLLSPTAQKKKKAGVGMDIGPMDGKMMGSRQVLLVSLSVMSLWFTFVAPMALQTPGSGPQIRLEGSGVGEVH